MKHLKKQLLKDLKGQTVKDIIIDNNRTEIVFDSGCKLVSLVSSDGEYLYQYVLDINKEMHVL